VTTTLSPERTRVAATLSPERTRVTAVMTSFNRKAQTLASLRALRTTAQLANVDLTAILVDDASSDGTADAVRDEQPWVEVIEGSGDLFWSRGMHQAFARALSKGADYYLWLNDDTQLLSDALGRLLTQSAAMARTQGKPVILVGATALPGSDTISYGGRVPVSRLRPFQYRLVFSSEHPVPCTAIEGNCVLIPHDVAVRVGNLDPAFEHAMGDTDYGLRALKAGYALYVSGGVVGHCARNPIRGTYLDRSLPFMQRWRLILSRKGLPVRSWFHFCRRHGGRLWPLHFAWPYAKVFLTSSVIVLFMAEVLGS
jgi:GT2 family glycosyltransferase